MIRKWAAPVVTALAFAAPASAMQAAAPSDPAASQTTVQEPSRHAVHFLTAPKWVRAPTRAELSALFPDSARDAGLNGETITVCRITAQGRLTACVVAEEKPTGYGFGRASLQALALIQISPPEDGRPLADERLALRFRWGGETTIQVVAPGRPVAAPPANPLPQPAAAPSP